MGSAFNEPEYIQVDLGDVYALDELTLYWEGAYAVRYTVGYQKMVQTTLRWMISLAVIGVRM